MTFEQAKELHVTQLDLLYVELRRQLVEGIYKEDLDKAGDDFADQCKLFKDFNDMVCTTKTLAVRIKK